jgi:hypothetical protein
MQVKDLTFKDYASLKDRSQYDLYLRYGNFEPFDVFALGSFLELSFGTVKDFQYYAQQGLTWEIFFKSISELKDISFKALGLKSIFELHKARLYFIEQVTAINNMESDFLGHAPSAEEIQAGIEKFNDYGSFIQFDKLAVWYSLNFEEVGKLEYDFCFTKLKLEADRNEFNEKLNTIYKNKKT